MTSRAAASVRVFNRFYTRLVGVLSEQHLSLGLPLGQVRVLFEIGQLEPVEAQALEAHLGLDAGYLSKQLAALEKAKLIRRAASGADARRKRITATAKGRKKLEQIETQSELAAERLVTRLNAEQQRRLSDAMAQIQQLLDDDFDIQPEPSDSPSARACLNAYFSELGRVFPEGFDPTSSVTADPHEVAPPRGQFLLVRCAGRPRGCGAVKVLDDGIGEIKRMWLHPELRGRGVGRRLLEALESSARELGLKRVRLDTSSHLPDALRLYRAAGYREIRAYNDNPYAAHWFEKRLARKP